MKKKDDLWNILAAVAYETYWGDDIQLDNTEMTMWRSVAKAIIDKYKEMGGK